MALGVDAFAVKLAAMVVSATITAAAGCFYVQYFLFIDSGIAYGTWISIEALLTPIIGGVGTVFGALAGALVVKLLGEGIKLVTGDVPGLDLMILWRRACAGHPHCATRIGRRLRRYPHIFPAPHQTARADRGGGPWLSRFFRSKAFRAASAVCWPLMPPRCRPTRAASRR